VQHGPVPDAGDAAGAVDAGSSIAPGANFSVVISAYTAVNARGHFKSFHNI
jgi:hypothetical protein